MKVQSAEVSALLRLDASGFSSGIATAKTKLDEFVKLVNQLDFNKVKSSARTLQDTMGHLNTAFERFNVELSKAEAFNKIANGMKALVTSARQLAESNTSLIGTYQHLENLVGLFANVLSKTQVTLQGNLQVTRQVAESNNQLVNSTNRVSEANNRIASSVRVAGNGYSSYLSKINEVNLYLDRMRVTTSNAYSQIETRTKTFISTMTTGLPRIISGLNNVSTSASKVAVSFQGLGQQTEFAINKTVSSLQRASTEVQLFGDKFKLAMSESASSLQYLNNATQSFGTKVNPTFNSTATGIRNVTTATQGIQPTMNGASQSLKNFSQNLTTASNGTSTAKQRFNGLTQTLGGLRTMLSMVGSMFLFNFAHNMMISVSNTVKAKSEMMSFLHTMGLTKGQIDSFNVALDNTAQRFQRINKYNIGETVANIGLEFGLSAKEMEKAMSVTSMVTSEYLRAGRSADEAALAVKDIMQGQFQRLSRETGVKGEQLKEAGWSGDVNDVLGLMEALEKVAKARHWDVFAEKASSLNDMVLITQNRLSEWATDMSEGVVPVITGSFNALINIVDKVTEFFVGVGKALNLPNWTGTALMIGGLVTAIGTLVTATITWRTGMGLLQIAQNGLGQSILATIFKIDAETMAQMKATTVIKAKILGVQNETMANMGLMNILKAKVLGLDAESIAQKGLSATILETNMARMKEGAETTKNTAKNVSLLSSYVALQRGMTLNQVAGLKWYQQLALLNKQVDLAKAKNMSFGQSLKALITSLNATKVATTLLSASIVGLAGVMVGMYALATMKSAKTMGAFNDMVENGDDKIRKLKQQFGETSEEANTMTEAVEKARSAIGKFEERKYNANEMAGRTVAKYLEDAGIDAEKIREITNQSLRDANAGVSIVAKTGDEIENTYRGAANSIGLMKGKLNGEEYEEYAETMLTSADRIAVAQEKMRMSASSMDRFFGWIDFTVEQVGHWWNEFSKNLEHQDWGTAWENIWKGFMRGFGNLPIASDIWNSIFKSIKLEDHIVKGDVGASLAKMGTDFGNWIWDSIKNAFMGNPNDFSIAKILKDTLLKPFSDIGDNLNNSSWDLINDIFGNLKLPDLGELFSNLFSGGDSGTGGALKKIDMSWLHEYLGQFITSISDWWNGIDWSFITMQGGSIFNKLLGLDEGVDIGAMLGEKLGLAQQYITTFVTNLTNGFMNLPSTIWTYLNQIVTNMVSFASQLLANGLSAGSNFLNGVVTHISQLPSKVYSFITQTGSYIINGASQWVSNARSKATETVNAVISQVSQLPQKVYDEFVKIGQRIRDAVSGAVQAALQFGTDVKNAVLNALGIHSPGFVQEALAKEFADIGGRIAESRSDAESQATSFGQGIVDGMNAQLPLLQQQAQAITDAMSVSADSQAIDFSGQFVGDYQQDANTITGLNQVMTTDTATTFGMMGTTVNTTIDGISANLQTSYANMNTSQTTALTTMQNNNTNAYNRLQTTTTTSLNNMRNTTQNVTLQMVGAWNHMKDNIIASANQLKTQSTAHFNTLSDHIGTFYRKLQNPSMWGAGDKLPTRYYNSARGNRGRSAVRRAFGVSSPKGNYAGGLSPNNLPQTASLRKIRQMIGNNPIFDGLDMSQEVDVQQFLAMLGGSFGWNDWHPAHFDRVKSTSGEWKMRGPQIMHRIDTGQSFQVKEFYNSQPNISFSSFQSMAEALFSAIPYDFYWNSDKYGSWVAALQAGACNCWDGAHAILALANTCGFSGHIEHGTWNGLGHVYAVINGKKMDTTGWQNRRDWNGVSAGSPSNMKIGENKTVNVNIDMTGATFYGEDDFKQTMEDIAHEVMRKEVNASITVGI